MLLAERVCLDGLIVPQKRPAVMGKLSPGKQYWLLTGLAQVWYRC
jgi:hypothetical protein